MPGAIENQPAAGQPAAGEQPPTAPAGAPPAGGGAAPDPWTGLELSTEDRATVEGIISVGPKAVWDLLNGKRAANGDAKGLRLAREKAAALVEKPADAGEGWDPLDGVISAFADAKGAGSRLAEVQAAADAADFRAGVLEAAARTGKVERPDYLLFEAERAAKAAKAAGTAFDATAWVAAQASALLAPAFSGAAAPVAPPPAESGNPNGGPKNEPDSVESQIAAAYAAKNFDLALRLERKQKGLPE